MIAVVVGPDHSLAREQIRALIAERDPDGHNTSTLDGKTASLNDVMMSAASIGFFSTGRVVVVEDLLAHLAKPGARDGGSAPDWTGLFTAVPAESTLILADPSLLSIPAAVKKALPPDARTIICDPPRGHELVRWLRKKAKNQGAEMDEPTARLLAETIYPQSWTARANNPAFDRPPDLDVLRNEVAKLATAAHPGPITANHVRSLVDRGDEDRIFRFIDMAMTGQVGEATRELDRLLAAGEDPYKLLSQLSQNAELSTVMAAAGRRQPADVGKELQLSNPNRMTAIARGLRNQRPGMPAQAVKALRLADRRLKTGELRDPVDALHNALAAIASA